MPEREFIGREYELGILQSEWELDRPRMLILYGRRRVGKTRLISHFIESTTPAPRALYWVAEPTSSIEQLRSFSQALIKFDRDPANAAQVPDDFSYSSWGLDLKRHYRFL